MILDSRLYLFLDIPSNSQWLKFRKYLLSLFKHMMMTWNNLTKNQGELNGICYFTEIYFFFWVEDLLVY